MDDSSFSVQVLFIFTQSAHNAVLRSGKSWVHAVLKERDIKGDVTFFYTEGLPIGLLVDLDDLETDISASFENSFRNYMDTEHDGICALFSSYRVTPHEKGEMDFKIPCRPFVEPEMCRHYA